MLAGLDEYAYWTKLIHAAKLKFGGLIVMFLGAGPTELLFILALALLIFGPKRLPEIAKYIGKAINEIKSVTSGLQDAVQKDIMQPINEEIIKPIKETKDFNKTEETKETASSSFSDTGEVLDPKVEA